MDLTRVILGPVVTEKAEALKIGAHRIYTLRVDQNATKVDVRNALQKYFQVEVDSVRVMRTRPKSRTLGAGSMEKRHRSKKMLVTLAKDSAALDLASFKTA